LFAVNDKEAVVQQLVQILTSEGDTINSKVYSLIWVHLSFLIIFISH